MIQWRFLTRFLSPYMFRGNGKFISKNLSLSLSLVRISNRIVEKRSDDILDWTDLSIIPSKQDFLLLEIIILDKQWISTRIKKYRVFFTYDFVPWFYIQDWANILFLVPPSYEIRYKERGRVNVVSIRRHVNIVFRRHETATEKIASSKNRRIFEVSSQCSNESMKNLTPRN